VEGGKGGRQEGRKAEDAGSKGAREEGRKGKGRIAWREDGMAECLRRNSYSGKKNQKIGTADTEFFYAQSALPCTAVEWLMRYPMASAGS
jgi:hypothetical protein